MITFSIGAIFNSEEFFTVELNLYMKGISDLLIEYDDEPIEACQEEEDHDEGDAGVGRKPVYGGRLPVPPVGSLRLHHRAAPTQIPN